MKVIGNDEVNHICIVMLTHDEWDELGRAAEIPYDKRSTKPGNVLGLDVLRQRNAGLSDLKSMRKDLMAVQKKWDALAVRLDATLDK